MRKFFFLIAIATCTYSFSSNETNILENMNMVDLVNNSYKGQSAINTLTKNSIEVNIAAVDCGDIAADVYATAMTSGYSQEDSLAMADTMFVACSVLKFVGANL